MNRTTVQVMLFVAMIIVAAAVAVLCRPVSVPPTSVSKSQPLAAFISTSVPGLSADRTVARFNAIRGNTSLEADFTLRNDASNVFHILNLECDCGCLVASVSVREIAPGGTAIIHLHTNVADAPKTNVEHYVVVTFSHSAGVAQALRLKIEGSVAQPQLLFPFPRHLAFHGGSRDTTLYVWGPRNIVVQLPANIDVSDGDVELDLSSEGQDDLAAREVNIHDSGEHAKTNSSVKLRINGRSNSVENIVIERVG